MQLLGLRGPWRCQVCRDTDCLCSRSYGPIRVFFRASNSWLSEGLFGQSFSIAPSIQALRRLPCLGSYPVVQRIRHIEGPPPWLGSYSVDQHVRHLKGHPGWGSYSVVQCVRHLMGQPFYCPAADIGMCRERSYGDGSTPLCVTQHYHLASTAAWLSSTSISHHYLLPHIPSICLSVVNSSPRPGTAPQSLNSNSQPLCLPGDLHPCPGYVRL